MSKAMSVKKSNHSKGKGPSKAQVSEDNKI
jgi:hypothetical protein